MKTINEIIDKAGKFHKDVETISVRQLKLFVEKWIMALKLSCGDDGEGYIKIPAQIDILRKIFDIGKSDVKTETTKLKTLKELYEYDLSEEAGRDNGDLLEFVEDLQQEAREWIDELEKSKTEVPKGVKLTKDELNNGKTSTQLWIKHFFNLKEL